ncbi:Flp pilus assembly protein CpaB [Pseudomonas sp. ATCC 13867]|uniref:Flp pilus assembly protein CpaB n=1 Tax=Pseudomonas sp. ATCC 13867 TaxID=1294143 RepID=UPI0002C4F5EE|nr:Flp pilus assembly protein CpaB [Pseudomonas sp. ATCC 13867]AGI23044.1 Flp pilus assembly protein CpaB [Pseudomonas sp. ATCC 13867]RFQ25137.1 Flp pilus assembly protein CpaB [Pseudomonas sp. ATCC 13867]
MNSKVLMVFAGLLLLCAGVVGYLGLSVGKSAAPVAGAVKDVAPAAMAEADKLQRTPVVVARRDLPALTVMGNDDLAIEMLHTAPAGSYPKPEALIGQRVWVAVPAGSILSGALLEPGGPLARTIRPDERAMAIAVDEVIGGGGFVLPGDYVDVMLFVQDQRNAERVVSAQVVLPGVRVLTYGEQIAVASDGQARNGAESKDKTPRPPRTAVLAVPAESASRLMLASQAGSLRLAVRSKDENLYEKEQQGRYIQASLNASGSQPITLEQLLGKARSAPAVRQVSAPAVSPGVVVYRGTTVTREAH